MKFAAILSYILVAFVATAAANPQRGGRQGNGQGGFGGFGGGNNNNNNNGGNNNNNNNGGQNNGNNNNQNNNNNGGQNNNNNNGGNNNADNGDPQSSTTLDPAVIATGFASDGQENAEAGQVPSLTSTNNFINFCLTVPDKPITNGQQITGGSCNPAPMGVIASTSNMPSSKFVVPKNGDTIAANQEFTIQMAINNIETGNFVNAQTNYYAGPQQINGQGNIIGHTHVVIEKLQSLDQTTPTDPSVFAFFKGINGAAQNGVVTADVTDGLPEGVYRIASINSAANHQPVLVAVAQHGSLDDMAYFTVSNNAGADNADNNNNGQNNNNNGQNNNNGGNNNGQQNNGGNNNGQQNNGQQNNGGNNNNQNRGGFGGGFGGGRNGGRGRGRGRRHLTF